ncbi:hypothetical protein Sjap_004896 [Stephania japonica]|uniref:Retrotransposon gag domain-containing protein n=1 Tax=Stephania japonica TaxID=461633 RepID=A0AAP0K4K5_9MAGN
MQDQQLRLLRELAPVTTMTPSTPTTPLPPTTSLGTETPIAAASTAPTPLATILEVVTVVPDAHVKATTFPMQTRIVPGETTTIVPTTETMPEKSLGVTAEARQWREFKMHDPAIFHEGTDIAAAEVFLKSHEKIHRIIATKEHMRASISSSMLQGEADDWWMTITATKGIPKDWIEFKTQFNQKYFPPTVFRAKRNEFMALRQSADESMMEYMDKFISLLPYVGGFAYTEADRVYYFTEDLLPVVRGFVVVTEPKSLQRAYERSLAKESYLLTHLEEEARLARSEVRSEDQHQDKRRRTNRFH